MKTKLIFLLGLVITFVNCTNNQAPYDTSHLDSTALAAIDLNTYKENVITLSSDGFQGRKPFTRGDTLAVNYIEKQFKNLGLQPGNGDSFFQEVPMVEITTKLNASKLIFKNKEGTTTALTHLNDFTLGSRKLQENIKVESTELVFVGFGIVAPEYNWNDYEGLNVKGKTVVVMVSDPGKYDKTLFKADTLTYYGRWTYKFEEAGRQGATGILLIHDQDAASYDWNVVRSGWSGPQLNLITDEQSEATPEFEGWLSTNATKDIFKLAKLDVNLLDEAKKRGFKAIPMGISTSVNLSNHMKYAKSNNVIAKINGSKRSDETVIYGAHWDHLGIGEAVQGDSIYNGAIDNATGVSALFEIAKAFKAAKIKPERTIVFVAWTAEEEGLLGSKFYTENPIFPINKTVSYINMDAFSALGQTKDVSIFGLGQTHLEDYVEKSAVKFGRTVRGEKNPTSGGFFRSDHFNFVKIGIPGLFMGSGSEFAEADTVAISKRRTALGGTYHTVRDEVNGNWDFNGIIADIKLFFDIGYTMSLEKSFPKFKTKSEFRELGEKRLAK